MDGRHESPQSCKQETRKRSAGAGRRKAAQHTDGRNFSVGLGQINVGNFRRLGLNTSSAFDPCQNLSAMQSVLTECFDRAGLTQSRVDPLQSALRKALPCYYSGNFSTGFRQGYVQKVVAAARSLPRLRSNPLSKESS